MHSTEYFLARVEANSDGCLIWKNFVDRQGYGKFRFESQMGYAHRGMYEATYGPIPEGMTVDHRCFNPPCVNPGHLRLLTLEDNRRNQRSAHATHCKSGHEFTLENTYIRPKSSGGNRQCRKCNALAVAKYTDSRREAA